jgi:hypothetical protein
VSQFCPKCSGVIYNRRSKLCGFCGAELPAELLFSPEELEVLDRHEAEAEARQQEQRTKEQAETEARVRAAQAGPDYIGFG